MKKMETGLEFYQGGNDFLDGYCGAAAAGTIARGIAVKAVTMTIKAAAKAVFGGPIGWFLAASDAVCLGYDIYQGMN